VGFDSSSALYVQVENRSDNDQMLFFNSRINTYYKQDLFQTLSIND
jgi:hypothetical protein